ncbi:MAM domain-containing glycosylphosphatidylinositol anchor protein 2-like [Mytilus galloprovincialis]|uniref:MAM domain-containing glycosylphosphatidylinositol anchor protein 2-like n=1 Tax=Mytilus galloprovincialis TaxID=29158 RepID=UPI003F7C8528
MELRLETPCDSSPCENDSKCIVNGSGYICTCITECNGNDYTDYKCDADNYVNQTCFLDQDVWCDDTDWIRWQDKTPSSFTGPSSAAEGSFYFYVTSSGIPNSSKARFVSKPLQTDNYTCLSFNYHMYGSTMGSLLVYQDNKQDWMKSKNQGNKWHFQQISILPYISRITFEALTGYGSESDIAIDNITITAGFC